MSKSPAPVSGAAFAAEARRHFPGVTDEELAQLERDWRLVERWLARLPRDLGDADEPAHCFTPPRAPR